MIFLRREETMLSGPSHSGLALRERILCSGRKGAGGSFPKAAALLGQSHMRVVT